MSQTRSHISLADADSCIRPHGIQTAADASSPGKYLHWSPAGQRHVGSDVQGLKNRYFRVFALCGTDKLNLEPVPVQLDPEKPSHRTPQTASWPVPGTSCLLPNPSCHKDTHNLRVCMPYPAFATLTVDFFSVFWRGCL